MNIKEVKYGVTPKGEEIFLYEMVCGGGVTLRFCNIGAAIVSVCVPDKNGKVEDVTLGYDYLFHYIGDGPCFGKVPGRVANRIAGGRFELDGKSYTLPINNGPNHNHGGDNGYANRIWNSRIEGEGVLFTLSAPDGDDGYPGAVEVAARYTWIPDEKNCRGSAEPLGQIVGESCIGKLRIELTGTTDAATVLNLTNHAYFNLDGAGAGTIYGHHLQLAASRYLPTDETLIPTGELRPVAGTPMDFTTGALIGSRAGEDFPALKYGKGYDACWAVDGWEERYERSGPEESPCPSSPLRRVASLWSTGSGRLLNVYSQQPGVIVYTGNWLGGCPEGKNGAVYNDYDGVAIECQKFPDAPNRPNFPSVLLRKGELYLNAIEFEFGLLN